MKHLRTEHLLTAVMCAIIIFIFSSSAAAGVIYVKWNSPGTGTPPVYNGASWDTAFHKVQDGINAASSGDEVRVAGSYDESITMKDGVALYGGFSGTETSRDQRDWCERPCILQCLYRPGWSTVISVPANAGSSTRIDGFTVGRQVSILHARYSMTYGINCAAGSSPVIANNVLREMETGIVGASSTIINNVVMDNVTGIAGGSKIVGNTLVWNSTGISPSSTTLIANNIIAFNDYGITSQFGTGVVKSNCFYGNKKSADSLSVEPVGVDGNILADPLFAGTDYANVHIQPDSPCVNKGDDSLVDPGSTDMDGQARIQDGQVDMGADESDGTRWGAGPYAVVRVSPTGSDMNDGSGWDDAHALATPQQAIDVAAAKCGEVWVAAGAYTPGHGVLALRNRVAAYGGFAGNETTRDQRDWRQHESVLGYECVDIYRCPSTVNRLDGFVLRPGNGEGVRCKGSSPTIANNSIIGSRGTAIDVTDATDVLFAIACSPVISGNTITGCGSGINAVFWFSPANTLFVSNNYILGNTYDGIKLQYVNATVVENKIGENGFRGIYCSSMVKGSITSNLVCNNKSVGIRFSDDNLPAWVGTTTVANNTIVGNGLSPIVPGLWGTGRVLATNNIVAFNGTGIQASFGPSPCGNNVFGNVHGDFVDMAKNPSGTNGNISMDPLFVNPLGGDYRLWWNSPCVDAGTNEGAPAFDLLGYPRPIDGNLDGIAITDMGAYEYAPVQVILDVLPGESPNRIPIQKNGMVTVAILGTPTFDVRSIAPASIFFGPGKAVEAHGRAHYEDLNCDGRPDMLLHFRCPDIGLQPGVSTVYLYGRLTTGEPFAGSDTVIVSGKVK